MVIHKKKRETLNGKYKSLFHQRMVDKNRKIKILMYYCIKCELEIQTAKDRPWSFDAPQQHHV